MKAPLLALVLATFVSAGCQSSGQDMNDHWNARSSVPRASRFFLGYDAEKDGSYRDFAWERKQDINLFMRRHFFHHNPDNPYHEELPSRFDPRPRNSLLPNPVHYIHLEGMLVGLASLGAGGGFIPIPVDSILGTLEGSIDAGPSGWEEFWEGINETAGGTIGTVTTSFVHKWIGPPIGGAVKGVHEVID